ncbi:glycoside hydrolase family 5 protein [Pisolithus croceorrhizus]|nr:glycoside hydrolase family 5 protein [Pisolithus croceorrhizus]KAI6125906.1 glycoside hydrolase family 5 protein [Pisolithus croceorrhizus]
MSGLFWFSLLAALVPQVFAQLPVEKIYGVNLGSWLLLEPWMLPQGWTDMGGQICADCSQCIESEFAFAMAYPDTVDQTFAKHWDSWFTQSDLQDLKNAGINTLRIPLGYWIVEALVERPVENYPRGGLEYLRRGLGWVRDSGMHVILDHHALPGVQTPGQEFTGQCTNDVQFYTPHNYHRALVWTAVMTTLSHLDPQFSSVFAIEAVNEPIMDASQTPGYGDFQKNFVKTVRAIEALLGIQVTGYNPNLPVSLPTTNFTATLQQACSLSLFDADVVDALLDAIPILSGIGLQYGLTDTLTSEPFNSGRSPLVTNFMDVNWQYDNPPNPANAAIGPQGYDNHLYYSYGVADADPTAYMQSICNLQRIQNDAVLGDSPLWFGEWGLSTQFDASDSFLKQWGDAQKWAYGQSAGWIYWNFKTEISNLTNGTELARQWSYLEALNMDLLPQNAASYYDDNVCQPYINKTSSKIRSVPAEDAAVASAPVVNPSTPSKAPPLKLSDHRRRLVKKHYSF